MKQRKEPSRARRSRIANWLDALTERFRRHHKMAAGYRALAVDEPREADANAWSEALLPLFDSERW
ncbi:MAG TPA: hypothetical protein VMV10_10885 [Pirellulales bacterium]|nr:hypothetical protein [Pirellulales bacterium]